MKAALLSLCAAAVLAGCATHSKEDIAAVRAAGVPPRTVAKLERDRVLEPSDLVELRRHRVRDEIPVKHLRDVGVDYLPQRDDLRRLRSAGVRPLVIDELIRASQRFVEDRYAEPQLVTWGIAAPYDPWYMHYGYHPLDPWFY